MAALSITAANVVAGANAILKQYTAGATITQGQAVYLDSATNTVKLADADASAAAADVIGVAMNSALSGQPITVNTDDDDFTPGATLVMATLYGLSATAGGICSTADFANGQYIAFMLMPKSTTKAKLKIVKAGAIAA